MHLKMQMTNTNKTKTTIAETIMSFVFLGRGFPFPGSKELKITNRLCTVVILSGDDINFNKNVLFFHKYSCRHCEWFKKIAFKNRRAIVFYSFCVNHMLCCLNCCDHAIFFLLNVKDF